ncbi:MAG: type VI secretion system tip protein TssI/VgrG [Candidatus Thiodiazotropha sp.]
MSITQAKRQVRIHTPLGQDKLQLASLYANENLGRLFEYHAELLSDDGAIEPDRLLGQRVDIELDLPNQSKRHFNAFVSRFTLIGESGKLCRYHALLHPWLWFLTRTSDCRIYQNMTAAEIIKAVFDDNGFTEYEENYGESYRTREYCVQYRETDFDFVSRLMEEEGIYYFFRHAKDNHTLVLCDNYGSHKPLQGDSKLPFHAKTGGGGQRGKESITRWHMSKQVQPGRYAHTDYDFTKPRATLMANAPLARGHTLSDFEIFDYPGIYDQASDGESYARSRIEELHVSHEVMQGESDVRRLAVGELFTLTDHPRKDQNREYLITAASYQLHSDMNEATAGNSGEPIYHCEFSCIHSRESFRSARTTPKPTVQGPQTAVVVGRAGEEIFTDKYGRVKVQFHWDRYGESNENSSCWVRVAQPWAGKNWGAMSIPRIGQEVIVEFLDGDPDRPIITGSVYNAEQMPPWSLPASQTQSGILSRSTKTGTQENANALRFEDKKGEEQLWLHAEKDQLTEVENDETKWVGNDRKKTIDGNETTTVHKNRTETVDQNETINIHQNRTETVDQNETITVHQNRTETVDQNETITIGANRTENVTGHETIGIGGNREVTISGNKIETVTLGKAETIVAAKALSTGGAYQVTVGGLMNTTVVLMQTEEVGQSKTVLVKHTFSIRSGDEFKVDVGNGASTLSLKKDGSIVIKGKTIKLEASDHIWANGHLVDIN